MFDFLNLFTIVHVAISLLGIGSGGVVVCGFLNSQRLDRWTLFFLTTTVLTSVTGFGFPAERITPAHVVGVVSLLALGLAVYARYARRLQGKWLGLFVMSSIIAFYLNSFVLVVQLFQKIPALKAIAPTQTEPEFAITQSVLLIGFVVVAVLALRRFHPSASPVRVVV
ncbi:hypothetical protein [Rhodopirellula sp. SWK7]|uniref:hypothetical protein n=1 Tax=Rhodopirellula sp. SWK7 TaxID=595460 RepID=UPI0005C77A62|nr:hypothetical protein [Rhodopirellula sp. SWK7]